MFLEKTLESPLDCKEIKPVNPKGNQSGISTGRTDAEAEAPILWPPDVKSWLIRKDPEAGKDWKQEEKGTTEDETVGWHHLLDGQELEQSTGVSDGQGSLAQRVRHDWATELIFVYIFVYDLVRLNPTDCESILFRNSVSLVTRTGSDHKTPMRPAVSVRLHYVTVNKAPSQLTFENPIHHGVFSHPENFQGQNLSLLLPAATPMSS